MSFYKVYISSTYRDLAPYRRVVMESLHKVPNFKVVGMEYYTAEATQPLDRCLQDVSECQIYLLILANRYGWVIDGHQQSVTHLEYLRARQENKVILVFKADNRDGRFPGDEDTDGQPPASEKAARLAALKTEVGNARLSHPEGFTSEYHLALQVMESLVRHPRVDFDGELPEDRKIFCDRANQVYDFYELVKKQEPFNVFLVQGDRMNLGKSLVERLTKYYLGLPEPVLVSYHEFIADPSYPNFRRRLVNELCDKLRPADLTAATDPAGLLAALRDDGRPTLALLSSVSNAVQWQSGYAFLNQLLGEFARASAAVGGVRVFWFIVIDVPDALQQGLTAVEVWAAPRLNTLCETDIEHWLRTYIDSDDGTVYDLQELCFPTTLQPPCVLTMRDAQRQIGEFIARFNRRRKVGDAAMLKVLP